MRHDRVMVQGSGSGGTLALTGLGLYGDRLRAAVSVDGMASSAQLMPIRRPVLLVRGLVSPPLDAGSAEQLLWRLRSAKVSSWFVAPRDRRDMLASDAEQLGARRVMAQFIAAQLGD
jgi:pimeloyl-ACP methyl ester carboxylesterase